MFTHQFILVFHSRNRARGFGADPGSHRDREPFKNIDAGVVYDHRCPGLRGKQDIRVEPDKGVFFPGGHEPPERIVSLGLRLRAGLLQPGHRPGLPGDLRFVHSEKNQCAESLSCCHDYRDFRGPSGGLDDFPVRFQPGA